jgi:hypothetical protein
MGAACSECRGLASTAKGHSIACKKCAPKVKGAKVPAPAGAPVEVPLEEQEYLEVTPVPVVAETAED